ncbi:hypothetical protein ACGFJC_47050 [Nonomuraea fuscirosea]|uniref:hypothetical protein n=1 Tax=Nonomuraea fuscirosea TaxID=1291556 RepID=UPI00371AD967
MQYTPAELVTAWQDATTAHEQVQRIAADLKGDIEAYPTLRVTAAAARDAYAKWGDLFTYDAIADQIRDLGRHVRAYLFSLTDDDIYQLAVGYGFPGHVVYEVSAHALRWWLDTAWADDNPKKTYVYEEAIRRGYKRAVQDPDAIKTRLFVIFTSGI